MILRLLYSCGLRIGETINLKMKEVDLENGILTMIHTKGDKQRLVPMDQTMTDILVRYCMALGLLGKKDAWLFPSAVIDKPVSHSVVKYRFSKILKMNNIPQPTAAIKPKSKKNHPIRRCTCYNAHIRYLVPNPSGTKFPCKHSYERMIL